MHTMKRFAASVFSAAMLFASPAPLAFAADSPASSAVQQAQATITPKSITSSTAEYEARITYPVISGLADKAFEAQLNAELYQYVTNTLKSFQQQISENAADAKEFGWKMPFGDLEISYEVHTNGKLLSFSLTQYVFTGGAHGLTTEVFYNIANLPKAQKLELSDLFQPGYDYRNILSMMIKLQIDQLSKEEQLPYWFESIDKNQPFSIQDGDLVIHFGPYEIAPYVAGLPSFTISKYRCHNLLKPQIQALLQQK